MQERQQIGLLIIATNKYKQFFPQLLEGIKKNFLLRCDITIFLFTDEYISCEFDFRVKIEQHPIPSYKFPEATMLRYAVFRKFQNYFSKMDYLFYSDIDMGYVSEVDESILGRIVVVRHPGFFTKGGGSWETREESQCYVRPEHRTNYYAGGFSGGLTGEYIGAITIMDMMISEDLNNGITPVWHDESALNKFITVCGVFKELDPSYCLVENMTLRKLWGIDHFEPKILALDKNHKEMRE